MSNEMLSSNSFPVLPRISKSFPEADGEPYTKEDDVFAFWLKEYVSRMPEQLTPNGTTKAARDAAIDAAHGAIVAKMPESTFIVTKTLRQPRSRQTEHGWVESSFLAAGHYVVNSAKGQVCWFGISEVQTTDAGWLEIFGKDISGPTRETVLTKLMRFGKLDAKAKPQVSGRLSKAKPAKQAKRRAKAKENAAKPRMK